MVLAPCKLMQIREIVMWQFAVSSGLPHFYGKISGYVVIYRGKDKNTTQGSLAELVGSCESAVSNPPSLGRPFFVHYNHFKEELSWTKFRES